MGCAKRSASERGRGSLAGIPSFVDAQQPGSTLSLARVPSTSSTEPTHGETPPTLTRIRRHAVINSQVTATELPRQREDPWDDSSSQLAD